MGRHFYCPVRQRCYNLGAEQPYLEAEKEVLKVIFERFGIDIFKSENSGQKWANVTFIDHALLVDESKQENRLEQRLDEILKELNEEGFITTRVLTDFGCREGWPLFTPRTFMMNFTDFKRITIEMDAPFIKYDNCNVWFHVDKEDFVYAFHIEYRDELE